MQGQLTTAEHAARVMAGSMTAAMAAASLAAGARYPLPWARQGGYCAPARTELASILRARRKPLRTSANYDLGTA